MDNLETCPICGAQAYIRKDMASDSIPTTANNWEAECLALRQKCHDIECHNKVLEDENSKLCAKYEELLKEKSGLERKLGFLEGQIEAYQYCVNCRR